ncbi:MAG: hypothetical protein R3C45_20935 [Phycisphaerales bacterium]
MLFEFRAIRTAPAENFRKLLPGAGGFRRAYCLGGLALFHLVHDLAFDGLHGDLEVAAAVTLDQRACALHQLADAVLDQGGELESAAELVHDLCRL